MIDKFNKETSDGEHRKQVEEDLMLVECDATTGEC